MKSFEKTAMILLLEFIELNPNAPLNVVYQKAKELLMLEEEQYKKLETTSKKYYLLLKRIQEDIKDI